MGTDMEGPFNGEAWRLGDDDSKQCVLCMWSLVELYVTCHMSRKEKDQGL